MMADPGKVYTFYSFKGGVGRSMAAANVAALLALWGKSVLLIDWDLEAPGLEYFFEDVGRSSSMGWSREKPSESPRQQRQSLPGILELVESEIGIDSVSWRQCLISILRGENGGSLSFISAGRSSDDYMDRVQSIDWDLKFREKDLGDKLNLMRNEWIGEFDYVIIDSRTGISDIGGICTIILPDILIVFFTANEQSIQGCDEVIRRARNAQDKLPDERDRLIAVPVLTRDERQVEYEQSNEWRKRAAEIMAPHFRDWMRRDVEPFRVLQQLYIPYSAYWSFGERLPVLEAKDDLADPASISSAYNRLASLLNSGLKWEAVEEVRREGKFSEMRFQIEELKFQLEQERKRHAKQTDYVAAARQSDVRIVFQDLIRTSSWFALATIAVGFLSSYLGSDLLWDLMAWLRQLFKSSGF